VDVGFGLDAGRDVVDAVHPSDHGLEAVEIDDESVWDLDGFLQSSLVSIIISFLWKG
jgi:hypothetical protein